MKKRNLIVLIFLIIVVCICCVSCSGEKNPNETPSNVGVQSVSLSANQLSIDVASERVLSATILPTNATNKNVTWQSSNTGVASVQNGTVRAISEGSATITVTTVDGSFTDTCVVTVNNSTIIVSAVTLSSSQGWCEIRILLL